MHTYRDASSLATRFHPAIKQTRSAGPGSAAQALALALAHPLHKAARSLWGARGGKQQGGHLGARPGAGPAERGWGRGHYLAARGAWPASPSSAPPAAAGRPPLLPAHPRRLTSPSLSSLTKKNLTLQYPWAQRLASWPAPHSELPDAAALKAPTPPHMKDQNSIQWYCKHTNRNLCNQNSSEKR